jgi:hypothetical protein
MTDLDVWLLDGVRRDVSREIKNRPIDRQIDVEIMNWWTKFGVREELTLPELRRIDSVDTDNMHSHIK